MCQIVIDANVTFRQILDEILTERPSLVSKQTKRTSYDKKKNKILKDQKIKKLNYMGELDMEPNIYKNMNKTILSIIDGSKLVDHRPQRKERESDVPFKGGPHLLISYKSGCSFALYNVFPPIPVPRRNPLLLHFSSFQD
jgi:hypothetical protein